MSTTGRTAGTDLQLLTKADALALARKLAEGFVDRRAETERLRELPEDTVAELVDSGLFRINQSSYWGGAELGTEAAVEIVAEIARGDGAVGWVYGVLASHCWLACLFPLEAQEEMWSADPNTMMSSSFVATEGLCERVEGGYRVRGRWPWSSGSRHSGWAMLGMTIPHGSGDEPPEVRWALLPKSDYTVDDDWRTVSMRGTGSNTIIVDDVFVPEHRTIDPWDIANGQAPGTVVNTAPMFRLPFAASLGYYLAATALGTAEATLAQWLAYISKKRQAFTGASMGTQQVTLIRAGHLGAVLDSARLIMTSATRAFDETILSGPLDQEMRVRGARDSAYAVRLCVDVVDTCMEFAGGSALFASNPIQKGWRDVHGVAAHAGLSTDSAYANYGHILLDVPLPPSPML